MRPQKVATGLIGPGNISSFIYFGLGVIEKNKIVVKFGQNAIFQGFLKVIFNRT